MPSNNWPSQFRGFRTPAAATRVKPPAVRVPSAPAQVPLTPSDYGLTCAAWAAMKHAQKEARVSGTMSAPRTLPEQLAQNQLIADHIARIDAYCGTTMAMPMPNEAPTAQTPITTMSPSEFGLTCDAWAAMTRGQKEAQVSSTFAAPRSVPEQLAQNQWIADNIARVDAYCIITSVPTIVSTPPATAPAPLPPASFGLTCDAWAAMTHDQKWARISSPMSAPRSEIERAVQAANIETLISRVDLFCIPPAPGVPTIVSTPQAQTALGPTTSLSPASFGLTCEAWGAMTHDQKWARISSPMSAPRSEVERAVQAANIETLISRVDLYCAGTARDVLTIAGPGTPPSSPGVPTLVSEAVGVPSESFTPLSPAGFGLTCEVWAAMTHEQKWARISSPMSAARSEFERLAQIQQIATIVDRINLYCAGASAPGPLTIATTPAPGAMKTLSYVKTRAAGQVEPTSDLTPPTPPPAATGMSKTAVGLLSFTVGLGVGAGALWLIKKPRASEYELSRAS